MKSKVTGKVLVSLVAIGAMLGFVAQLTAAALPAGVYVASNPTSGPAQILRFDMNTQAPLGVFATLPAGSLGTGMSFGPDGKLWVADFVNGAIDTVDGSGTVTPVITGIPDVVGSSWFHYSGATPADYLFYTQANPVHKAFRTTWNGSGVSGTINTETTMDNWGTTGWDGAGDGRIYSLFAVPNNAIGFVWAAPFGAPNNDGSWCGACGIGHLDIKYNAANALYYETRTSEFGGTDAITVRNFSGGVSFGPTTDPLLIKPRMLDFTALNQYALITQAGGNVVKYDISTHVISPYIATGSGGLNNPWGIVFVPEPTTLALLGLGGLLLIRRRRSDLVGRGA